MDPLYLRRWRPREVRESGESAEDVGEEWGKGYKKLKKEVQKSVRNRILLF